MNNKERQQRRFERDRKRRKEKRLQKEKELCRYDKFTDIDELIDCFYKCKKGVSWKKSIQNFEMNLSFIISSRKSSRYLPPTVHLEGIINERFCGSSFFAIDINLL